MNASLTNIYFRILKWMEKLNFKLSLFYSRRMAFKYRREYLQKGGTSVLTRQIKKRIKEYARERFGSKAYWPHLAYFTEIRREFIEGCIPEDYYTYILEPRLNPPAYNKLGDLRTSDHRRYGDFAIKPLALSISGIFYNADFEILDQGKLREVLNDYDDDIVLKQEFGWGGKQVRIMHSSEFKPEDLQKGINYIIQPRLKQYKALNDLYPDSVNTFRVITFLKKNGSVEVLYTMLRYGVDGIKVDNMTSGGQCLYFEPSGKPSKIGFDTFGLPVGERHKNTGYRFADLEIPNFHKIGGQCKASHMKYPYIRLIAWDICLDESGEPKLIEWNTHAPSFTWEDAMFGPFLTDDSELQ